MIHRTRKTGTNGTIIRVIMDSNASPLLTHKNNISWKMRRDMQCSHRDPGHHPINNEATIVAIQKSVHGLKAVEPTHYRPNGTPNARLNKEYISCKHVGQRTTRKCMLTEMKKYRINGQSNRIKINDLSVRRLPKPL